MTVRNATASPQAVWLHGSCGGVPVDFGAATLAPHATWAARTSVVIPHPRLWSPGSPKLYRATLSLTDARRRPLGGYLDYSGIRSIAVRHGRLELNGHPRRRADPAQTAQLLAWVRQLGRPSSAPITPGAR